MKRTISTAIWTAIVTVATTAIAAQPPTPAPTTPQPPTTTTAQSTAPSSDSKKITVVGCLKEAPGSATAVPGATGTTGATTTAGAAGAAAATDTASAPKYVLTNATMSSADSAAAPNAATTTTTPGATTTTAGSQTYRLIANASALTAHVGKKLELIGTLDAQGASTDTAAGAEASGPALRVESGKIVANSCSE